MGSTSKIVSEGGPSDPFGSPQKIIIICRYVGVNTRLANLNNLPISPPELSSVQFTLVGCLI